MSWHYSQALVAAYLAASSLDGGLFAPLKETDMPETYCWRDKTTESLNLFQFGMMSAPSTADPGVGSWIAYLLVSRANRSRSQANKQEPMTTDTSGLLCFESSKSLPRGGLLEKMSKALLTSKTAWFSRLCVLTWKEKVTKSGR